MWLSGRGKIISSVATGMDCRGMDADEMLDDFPLELHETNAVIGLVNHLAV